MEKTIAILGSTGSIGTQTLEVVRENKDIRVAGLSAGSNITLLEKQIREFHPSLAAVWDEEQAKILAGRVSDLEVKVVSGMDGLGYKEILSYLDGTWSLEEAVYVLKRDTRHFAKRQITWFKRERQVEWFDKQEFGYDSQAILDAMLASLREKKIIE